MMGSCFSTEVGNLLSGDGYKVVLNPFGILFNPASIVSSIERMESGIHFSREDVIPREGQYVSFFHHGSFRRPSEKEFLENANAALDAAVDSFSAADTMILTLGTAWVFRHIERGYIVSNCHKVPAREFSREFLQVEDIVALLGPVIARHRDKRWIFTVSPIRHLADGAHGNQISKSTLLLAIDSLQKQFPFVEYFPAYEIMMDELRDHCWYVDGRNHPTPEAVRQIYDRFRRMPILTCHGITASGNGDV